MYLYDTLHNLSTHHARFAFLCPHVVCPVALALSRAGRADSERVQSGPTQSTRLVDPAIVSRSLSTTALYPCLPRLRRVAQANIPWALPQTTSGQSPRRCRLNPVPRPQVV